MFHNKTLADSLSEKRNSFNLIRLAAALSVLISHAYILVGQSEMQPLRDWTSYTIGQHAVNIFFVLSGLMLTQSLTRDPNIWNFVTARILRIFPALFGFGLFFSFLLGPLLTTVELGAYFADRHTYSYPIDLLFRFHEAQPPHGMFTDLPVPGVVNDSLWTIRYELLAYAALVVMFVLGVAKTRLGSLLCLAGMMAALTIINAGWIGGLHTPLEQLSRYAVCFLIGVNLFHWKDRVTTQWWPLLATLAFAYLVSGTPLAPLGAILFAAHLTISIGSRSFGVLTAWTSKNDISYGTYIYGWPTQQVLLTFFPTLTPIVFAIASMAITPIFGALSWILVEKPALGLKKRLRRPISAAAIGAEAYR